MDNHGSSATKFFFELTPEKILESVERLGTRCTGRVLALNSMENRVYEAELDIDLAPDAGRWDAFVVVKFYRPGRWTREQILEEHQFLRECREAELPVVAPLTFPDGATLCEVPGAGIFFAAFPKMGGRLLDEMSPEELRRVGRLLGRLHAIGSSGKFRHRIKLTIESYGRQNIDFLRQEKLLPASVETHYVSLADRIFDLAGPWLAQTPTQRIHGDCHVGNILWSGTGCTIVDFDDCLEGPCVQDLWLLTPGRDEQTFRNRELLLEGYDMMRDFDRTSLRLVEPLRALRMINFTTWIAKRFEDPAFKRVFVDYGSERYWREQLIALQEVAETLGLA